jgi:hypothetical protein
MATFAARRALDWTSPRALWTAAMERPRSSDEALIALAKVAANETLDSAAVDPPSLAESSHYLLRYLAERDLSVMHPNEPSDIGGLAGYLRSRLERAGRSAEAERIRELVLGRWYPILHDAGLEAQAEALKEAFEAHDRRGR